VTRILRVATWNIFAGRTWDGARVDLDLTLAILRRLEADLVVLQEVDRFQPRSHRTDQAGQLAGALGMEWRYAPALLGTPGSPGGWRAPAPGDPDPGGTAYGIALLSRLPLDQVETVLLPQSGRDEPRVALVAGLADGGRRMTVAGTHLSFVPGPNLGQLRALQRHLDDLGGPRLLLGDLNLWWPAVRLLSRPGWRPLVHGGTFRNRPPGSHAPLVQLDHVLAAGAGATVRRRGARIVGGPASDHRAVLVELEWGRTGQACGRSNQLW
jgi:endonuclease/exonuclease/phosphatase family metal-dependent hydrolase